MSMIRSASHSLCMLAALLGGLSGACSYTFDDEAQDIPLVGQGLNAATLLRLPALTLGWTERNGHLVGAIDRVELISGQDGAPWLLWGTAGMNLHLHRLHAPQVELEYSATQWHLDERSKELILIVPPAAPGQPAYSHFIPIGRDSLYVAPLPVADTQFEINDSLIASWDERAQSPEIHLLYKGQGASFERLTIPWTDSLPASWSFHKDARVISYLSWESGSGIIDATSGDIIVDKIRTWTLRDDQILYISKQGELRAYSGVLRQDSSLGFSFGTSDSIQTRLEPAMFVRCSSQGVQRVTFTDPGPSAVVRTIAPQPCERLYSIPSPKIYFRSEGNEYSVPLDGSELPRLLTEEGSTSGSAADQHAGMSLIATCSAQLKVYASRKPEPDDWKTTDGWIGDWQFMQRGLDITFSSDCGRVRWKDYAAREFNMGELLSAAVPRGEVLRLARNVLWYGVLPDGRVISTANMTLRGPQNRIVLIDEGRREAQLLLEGDFELIAMRPLSSKFPGSQEVLLEVKGSSNIPELILVPLPPIQP